MVDDGCRVGQKGGLPMKTVWWTVCCHCGVARKKGEFCVTYEHYPENNRWCYNQAREPPVERVGKLVDD